MQPSYKSFSSNSDKSKWLHHCKESQIPYVTITNRTSYSDVEFDYISFNAPVDIKLQAKEKFVTDTVLTITDKYKNHRTEISVVGWGFIKITNLAIDNAEYVAEELVKLINNVVKK
jgi:hypothetical protein